MMARLDVVQFARALPSAFCRGHPGAPWLRARGVVMRLDYATAKGADATISQMLSACRQQTFTADQGRNVAARDLPSFLAPA